MSFSKYHSKITRRMLEVLRSILKLGISWWQSFNQCAWNLPSGNSKWMKISGFFVTILLIDILSHVFLDYQIRPMRDEEGVDIPSCQSRVLWRSYGNCILNGFLVSEDCSKRVHCSFNSIQWQILHWIGFQSFCKSPYGLFSLVSMPFKFSTRFIDLKTPYIVQFYFLNPRSNLGKRTYFLLFISLMFGTVI